MGWDILSPGQTGGNISTSEVLQTDLLAWAADLRLQIKSFKLKATYDAE